MQVAEEKLIEEDLEGVVISVPAGFEHNEKATIRAAAEIPTSKGGPGLKVLGFIKEPVAAALSYFQTPLSDGTKILVYDLGGGTCDVAIVKSDSSAAEKYTVVDSEMIRIGGKDWDNKLSVYITHELEKNLVFICITIRPIPKKSKELQLKLNTVSVKCKAESIKIKYA